MIFVDLQGNTHDFDFDSPHGKYNLRSFQPLLLLTLMRQRSLPWSMQRYESLRGSTINEAVAPKHLLYSSSIIIIAATYKEFDPVSLIDKVNVKYEVHKNTRNNVRHISNVHEVFTSADTDIVKEPGRILIHQHLMDYMGDDIINNIKEAYVFKQQYLLLR